MAGQAMDQLVGRARRTTPLTTRTASKIDAPVRAPVLTSDEPVFLNAPVRRPSPLTSAELDASVVRTAGYSSARSELSAFAGAPIGRTPGACSPAYGMPITTCATVVTLSASVGSGSG